MKYMIEDVSGDEVSLHVVPGNDVHLIFHEPDGAYTSRLFTLEQFREFRRAVGYVWQEVHSDGE